MGLKKPAQLHRIRKQTRLDTPFKTITYLDSPAAAQPPGGQRLVLVPQENRISYAVLAGDGTVARAKSFLNESNLASSVFFRMVLEREALRQQAFGAYAVLSASPQFALIPNEELRPGREDAYRYTRILIDESVFKQEVACIGLPDMESSLVFVAPLPVRYLWDEYLPAYELGHVVVPLITMARQLGQQAPSHLLIQLFDTTAIIAACQEGRMVFCNAFRFRAEMDIVYFLHSVREVTGLSDDALPVYAVGEFDREGQAYAHLQTYIPQLRIPDFLQEKALGAQAGDSPFWKFGLLTL